MSNKKLLSKVALLTVLSSLLFSNIKADDFSHYTNLYFFGDSLTDSGSIGGLHFTTKPGYVWSEDIGIIAYNKAVTPAYTTTFILPLDFTLNNKGNNFAVGGALINSPTSNHILPNVNLPSATMQINNFLARGAIDPNAVYFLWAGYNDLLNQFNETVGPVLSSGQHIAMVKAANDLSKLIKRLQSAGVRNLILIGIPGLTPPKSAVLNTDQKTQIKNLMTSFNNALIPNLISKNLLYFDINQLIQTIVNNPLRYGFTNTTTPACNNYFVCNSPANGHMYADDIHPSTAFHKIISDWIYTSLEGASRAGLISMLPLNRYSAKWLTIDNQLQKFQNFDSKEQEFFIGGNYDRHTTNSSSGLPSTQSNGGDAIFGYQKSFGEKLLGGLTLGYYHAPFSLGNNQGSIKYNELTFTIFASYKLGSIYTNFLADCSNLNFTSSRNTILGPFNSVENGKTSGKQFSGRGQLGYNFTINKLVHGPLIGLMWERIHTNGFSETSSSVTAMTFSDQTRESLRSKIGWQITGEADLLRVKIYPYIQSTYDHEHKQDNRSYSAGFVNGISSMIIPTSNKTGGYGTLQAGINIELNKIISIGISGLTTISQPGAQNSSINTVLSIKC